MKLPVVSGVSLRELPDHISYVIDAHQNHPKSSGKDVRYWDRKTPYSIHPIWCAMTLLTETKLDQDIREDGAIALLFHDILEDTTKPLPANISPRVKTLVEEMTFETSTQEWSELWNKPKEVRLYKLYDKTSNLLDATWMKPDGYKKYVALVKRLVEDVEKNYGELNITKLARAVLP